MQPLPVESLIQILNADSAIALQTPPFCKSHGAAQQPKKALYGEMQGDKYLKGSK